MKGKTRSGFSFNVNDNIGDDIELLEDLTKLDKGDVTVLPEVLERILGDKQKKKLYDHVRTEDGRVPLTAVSDELAQIFAAQDKTKK